MDLDTASLVAPVLLVKQVMYSKFTILSLLGLLSLLLQLIRVKKQGNRPERAYTTMRVKQLTRYPIKSFRGVPCQSISATYTGFVHDRRFMLFKVEAGEAMLIGKSAELCLFTPSLEPEANPDTVVVNYAKDYVFSSPEKKVAEVPLVFPLEPDTESLQHMNVMVWWSPVVAYRMGSKYDSWFSERLGYPVIFVYIGENKRKVLGSMTPQIAARQQWEQSNFSGKASIVLRNLITSFGQTAVDEGISFADVAPYLIVSEKSRENVQNRLAKGASMDITKFRPNIVVEGAQTAYEEDYWNELQIGSQVKMTLTQGCARCSSINIDYNTGKFGDGEEGTVFKKLQKDRRVDAGLKFNPVFGKYAFLNRLPQGKTSAEIKVGDEIKVLKRNKHRSEFVWPGITTYSLDDTRNVKKKEGAPR